MAPDSRQMLSVAVVIAVLSVGLLLGAVGYRVAFTERPYDPLGSYPTQHVHHHVIHEGQMVVVTGTKCNDSNKPVTVRGSYSWQSVAPIGAFIPGSSGVAHRPPGCQTRTYANPIPEAVLDYTADNGGSVRWRLTGTETPIPPKGGDPSKAVPRVFESESFVILSERG